MRPGLLLYHPSRRGSPVGAGTRGRRADGTDAEKFSRPASRRSGGGAIAERRLGSGVARPGRPGLGGMPDPGMWILPWARRSVTQLLLHQPLLELRSPRFDSPGEKGAGVRWPYMVGAPSWMT